MKNPILNVVAALSDEEAIAVTEHYGTHNYHPLHVNLVRAKDCYAYDGAGKKYIDCIGCYSAVANGHLSEFVVDTLRAQLEKITLVSRAVYTSELAAFLKSLCEYTETDMACPMNTGAEAIETAIKLARKWAYTVKGVQKDKAEIIVGEQNFHGRTTTIVGFSSEQGYKEGFGPFTPGFVMVPFGDLAALESKINANTAAVLLEPIQAEGGIIFPPAGYMAALRQLCNRHNVLLIWDEIQTGFCRTGKKFAWQHEDAQPDLMCLGKALGGGVFPVSAVVGKREVMEVFKPGDHGSTFGGNPLGCVVAMAALQEMNAEGLAERSRQMGDRLLAGLRNLSFPFIEDVRGRGLLVGLEVAEGIDTVRLAEAFIENGILTKETRSRTFRFAPPLTISESLVDDIVARTRLALEAVAPKAAVA